MDNASALYALLLPGAITVRVIFNDPHADVPPNMEGRLKSYKAMAADGIKVGDLVLVDSPHDGIRAVTVVSIDAEPDLDFTSKISYKWIIGRVPLEAYRQRLDREEQFRQGLVRLERDKRREALRKDLEERYGNVGALLGVDPLPPIDVPSDLRPLTREPFAHELRDGDPRLLKIPTLGSVAVVTTTTLSVAEMSALIGSIKRFSAPGPETIIDIWRHSTGLVWWKFRNWPSNTCYCIHDVHDVHE